MKLETRDKNNYEDLNHERLRVSRFRRYELRSHHGHGHTNGHPTTFTSPTIDWPWQFINGDAVSIDIQRPRSNSRRAYLPASIALWPSADNGSNQKLYQPILTSDMAHVWPREAFSNLSCCIICP
jgi:hypothetical protein